MRLWIRTVQPDGLISYHVTNRFLESCRSHFETDTHIFVHASDKPDLPVEQVHDDTLRQLSLRDDVPPGQHCSGKVVVVGHTPQTEVLDL